MSGQYRQRNIFGFLLLLPDPAPACAVVGDVVLGSSISGLYQGLT